MQRITRVAAMTVGVSSALWSIVTTPARAQTQAHTEPSDGLPAGAAASRDQPWTRQVSVEGQVGYAAPLGYVGLAVDADILPWLSISGGLGTDLCEAKYLPLEVSKQRVRQLALMPRLRLPVFDGATFMTLGVGISRDPGSSTELLDTARVRQDDELGIEHRFDNGVRIRAFVGIGLGLNDPHRWAYGGAALGYAVVPNPDHSSVGSGSWYGWQPLLSDAVAALVAAEGSPSHEAARGALAIFTVTPAVIHVSHHNYGRAVLSAALRTTLMYLALHVNDNSPGSDYDIRGPGPFIIAGTLASLVDDLALSWR